MYLKNIIAKLLNLRKAIKNALLEKKEKFLKYLLKKYRHYIVAIKHTLNRRDYRYVLREVAERIKCFLFKKQTIRVVRYY